MTQIVPVNITRLPHGESLPLPFYGTEASAGMDLYAAIEGEVILGPGERTLVPTGICLGLEAGWEAQIRPRSGLALKHGITVLNTPGTIDADYRGEVKVILINLGDEPFAITREMRVAQMVVAPLVQAKLMVVDSLDETQRGAGGFGSTGTHG